MIWAAVTSGFGRFVRGESWAEPIDGPGVLRLSLSDDGRHWSEMGQHVWPGAGRALRIAWNGSRVLAVAKMQNSGQVLIGNDKGVSVALSPSHGESCVGVEALSDGSFRVGAVVSSAEWKTWLVDGDSLVATLESTNPVPNGWGDGWIDFKNATPQWVPDHRFWERNGHHLGIWGTWGGYIVGQSYIKDGIDAIKAESGELLRVCDGYSPVQPYAAELNGKIVVAFSSDAPQFVHSDDFRPAPVVSEPDITIPAISLCGHAMAMSFADDPEAPDWAEFCTLGRDDLHAAVSRAKARNVPVIGYWDHHEYDAGTMDTAAAIARAAGVRFIPQAMCYPKPGESAAAFTGRVEPTLVRLRRDYPDDAAVYGALYRQWNGTSYPLDTQQVLDCAAALYELCLKHRIRVLTWFAWRRPWQADKPLVDGVLKFPEFQQFAARLKACVPSRFQFPKQKAAAPVPQKPPNMPTKPAAITYATFVGVEAQQVADRFKAVHGVDPAPSDLYHNAYRRAFEGFTHQQVLEGIGPAPSVPQGAPRAKPERVSGSALLDVQGNFCNLLDGQGRVIYTPALTGAPDDVFDEWMRRQAEAGSTQVFFGPPIGGAAYPGVHWPNPDFWSDLPRFRAFVEKVLDTPAADGKGFRPVIFVGGDTFAESRFERWDELAAALDGLHQYLVLLVAWEPVIGGWRTAEVSKATKRLRELFPSATLDGHGSPTRWVSSSNPVEPDDPWQGDESGFFKKHGGEFLDAWFYQTQHGRDLYRPCTCPDSLKGQFTHVEECFLNRWEDGVARLGDGYHGWRRMKVVLYETVAYEFFRGQATSDQARDIATAAKKVADKWGVQLGYGNGLPW